MKLVIATVLIIMLAIAVAGEPTGKCVGMCRANAGLAK